jgi:nicotinamidase-related amidase
MTDLQLDPKRTALLLMDLQPAVIESVGVDEDLIARADAVLRWARQNGLHIGHVNIAFTEDERATIPVTNASFHALRDTDFLAHGRADAASHPSVSPAGDDIVVRKTRVGAFSTTDLQARLSALDIDTLVLAGISTSGVILSTVRDAADRDYRVIVLSDVVFDPDPEVNRVLLEQVFPAQAQVISADDLDQASLTGVAH